MPQNYVHTKHDFDTFSKNFKISENSKLLVLFQVGVSLHIRKSTGHQPTVEDES